MNDKPQVGQIFGSDTVCVSEGPSGVFTFCGTNEEDLSYLPYEGISPMSMAIFQNTKDIYIYTLNGGWGKWGGY